MRKLSIVIPCFNEINTLEQVVEKIYSVDFQGTAIEVVIVDDNSSDGSRELLLNDIECDVKLFNEKNFGKGYCIRRAIQASSGDVILVQDADLEYDPCDIPSLLKILKGENELVYGSRYLENKSARKGRSKSILFWGGRLITVAVNLLYDQKLTDVSTCYKLFYKKAYQKFNMKTNGFQFCVELTAKALSFKYDIKEVQINYVPRNKEDGKKINSLDGIKCLFTLTKLFLFKRA